MKLKIGFNKKKKGKKSKQRNKIEIFMIAVAAHCWMLDFLFCRQMKINRTEI